MSIAFYTLCFKGYYEAIHINISNCTIETLNFGLCGACRAGHYNIVELLLNYGANDWNRAFHVAYQHKNHKILILLIKKGGVPRQYKYPHNSKELILFLELGLEITKLKNIIGFHILQKELNTRKTNIWKIINNYLIPDLNNIIINFSLL